MTCLDFTIGLFFALWPLSLLMIVATWLLIIDLYKNFKKRKRVYRVRH